MTVARYTVCLLCLTAAAWSAKKADRPQTTPEDYLRAIRANDLKTLKEISRTGVGDVRDKLDWTPLHYAALYGSTEAVRIVLAGGGDPNARNKSEATPVMYGAYSLDKTRLMVEKGGDVNAKSSNGSTPLWVATGVKQNAQTIRYLLEKGADAKLIGPRDADYLIRTATYGDPQTVRLMLDKGLDPHRGNAAGFTALAGSVTCDGGKKARLLLEAGSDVNTANKEAGRVKNGPIALTQLTPLMFAATCGEPDTVSALLKAGAKVNLLDGRHMTALMLAVAVDGADAETVRLLISAGTDVNVADQNGETALDWARKHGNPEVIALLEKAGAKGKGLPPAPVKPAEYKPAARAAIERASALLAKSSEEFFREGGGCVGCHHQPFAGRAFAMVKASGLPAEPRLRQIFVDGLVADRAREMGRLPLMTGGGGGFDGFIYSLVGMAELGEPATEASDVMVHYIAESQEPSGAWSLPSNRPPMEESNITRTMLAIYSLKSYGWPARQAEFKERIARGRKWLAAVQAHTTVEEADRLVGLWLAGAAQEDLRQAAQGLLKEQRPDGGWAQTRNLDSDAFGTSAVLFSLRKVGMLQASDAAYQKGARYLLDTQFPDGSWYVRSRAVKLQPYFQSAFPYDHDQWISNPATAYAVMALAPVASQ